MTLREVWINDTDLGRYGFSLVPELQGWRDLASGSRPATAIPGLAGRFLLDGRPDIPSRQVTIQGFLRASSLAVLVENHRQLKSLLTGGRMELRLADDPDRLLYVELPDGKFPGAPPRLTSTQAPCVLKFEAMDPYWYDKQPTVLTPASTAASTRLRCPLGTAPIAPILIIMGGVTNPVITLRNQAGDVVSTLTWTGTLASTDFLEIDCAARTAKKTASGTLTDAVSGLSGDFPILTPEGNSYLESSWPTLEVTGGVLQVQYWRGWL